MSVDTTAGAKLWIGPQNNDADDETAYAALTYTEVKETEDLGEFGDQVGSTQFTSTGDRRVRKFKTTFDAGDMQLTIGKDPSDPGQIAMVAALASDSDYAFKVTLTDGSEGPPAGTPTTYYFRGKVMSWRTQLGNAEAVTKVSSTIAINSETVEVAAT